MHTRQESDEINMAEVSRILIEISDLKDSLSGISFENSKRNYAIGDFCNEIEIAIENICEGFDNEI